MSPSSQPGWAVMSEFVSSFLAWPPMQILDVREKFEIVFEIACGCKTVNRERKMRKKFFCTKFLSTAGGPGHPGKIPGTSRIPLFETQGRQSFEGGHEVFDPHPLAWKTPTPPGGLRTQKLNLCASFFLPESRSAGEKLLGG